MGLMEEETSAFLEQTFMTWPRLVLDGLSDEMVDEIVQNFLVVQEKVIRRCIAELGVSASMASAVAEPLTEEECRVVVVKSLKKVRHQHAALMALPSPSGSAH
jgi:hypothetical protein